jgi:hypothetical protein
MNCKIRITKEIEGLYPQYQPKVGKVYPAEYIEPFSKSQGSAICVVNILDKRIILRKGEFEIV